jgi:hypothetical protein
MTGMRYRLRTLLILMAVLPPALWASYPAVLDWYLFRRQWLSNDVAWHHFHGNESPPFYDALDRWLP